MGVPAFFRNLIKKYEIIRTNIDKPIKALYIDANCLFHPQCFKILDLHKDITDQRILFRKMVDRIIAYIDYMIRLTNPEDLVYIAVDGVAPLAKINQQRMRRFGYANNYRHAIYRKYGIKFNDSWTNIVITPGTEFMYDLHVELETYYKNKIRNETDPNCNYNIIYNSYLTPGEGEHKILQYIKSNYDLNNLKDIFDDRATIIYGLDADLIFLAMASGLPHIYLLRESDQFAKHCNDNNNDNNNDNKDSIEEELCYADIDFTKKSINEEFNEYYEKFMFNNRTSHDCIFDGNENDNDNDNEYKNNNNINNVNYINNINNINKHIMKFDFTNDYIFICYFLGNDFLPHLPSIDICANGMDIIFNVYMDVFQTFGCTLITIVNSKVVVNQEFILEFITILASKEENYFRSILPAYLHKQKRKRCHETVPYKIDIWNIENLKTKNQQFHDVIKLGHGEAHEWKYRYYSHYFKTDEHMQECVDKLCHNYIEGLMWVAKYYFEKCPTWKWQYKFTHAPFLSDIMIYLKDKHIMKDFNFESNSTNYINMYTQLVSVIPATYSHILPLPLQHLSNSFESSIIDMFPLTYELDMINKTQLYKCVPIIPYLDIDRVDDAINNILKLNHLSEKDKEKSTIADEIIINRHKKYKKKVIIQKNNNTK